MNKSKFYFAGLFCLLLLFTGIAPARDTRSMQRPMLWQINSTPASYLFGTIHLPDPRLSKLEPRVEAAFTKSDAVYTEIELDPAKQMESAMKMMRSDGKTLSQTLPNDVRELLDARLKKINPQLNAVPFEPMKTWAIYAMVALLEQQMKYPNIKPLDMMLFERAQKEGKKAGGIETIDEQLGYFEQFSEQEQITLLKTTLEQMNEMEAKGEDMTELMLQWYLTGDIESFSDLMQKVPLAEDEKLNQRIEKILLTDRNKLMAERIVKMLSGKTGKSYFFAVGAAHLGGEQSVLKHLEKMGYSAKQVPASSPLAQ